MLDARLYAVMNWSMLLDGVLFWWLVLGPSRPAPAHEGYLVRFALALGVLPPQVAIGALISLSPRQLYPFFELCGRVFPAIGAMADQALGGLVIWVPGAMMSGLAVSVLLSTLLRNE
jgi:putative membrane protein